MAERKERKGRSGKEKKKKQKQNKKCQSSIREGDASELRNGKSW